MYGKKEELKVMFAARVTAELDRMITGTLTNLSHLTTECQVKRTHSRSGLCFANTENLQLVTAPLAQRND